MTGESQLDFETKYLQGESIQVSTDKTITQIASDAYVQGFIAGRLKPPTEIEIEAARRYLTNNALIRQGTTHITVSHALADMCREMRYALTKRTTNAPAWPSPHENRQPASQSHERTKGEQAMSNDIDKSVNRLNAAETIRRQAIALQKHISEALADLQTLSGSEDIQISHALTMATIQASKALKQAHLMQDSADMLDQADQRDEENKISRMLMHKIAQQGE